MMMLCIAFDRQKEKIYDPKLVFSNSNGHRKTKAHDQWCVATTQSSMHQIIILCQPNQHTHPIPTFYRTTTTPQLRNNLIIQLKL
mmetsp:Transcript_21019/g.42882  ORF Transcript_21019/g.42882 Transcript_21019/m.42882 type:complete len:85 (-) Transcript_21019:539-793(-)